MEIKYALYAVIESDSFERDLIGYYDEEIDSNELEEVIRSAMGSNYYYDYAYFEKQYHRSI